MKQILTPFGEIEIWIDGEKIPYSAEKAESGNPACPDLLGRVRIPVPFVPDGKPHQIACVFQPNGQYRRYTESGERLVCQSFTNTSGFKLSVGLEWEVTASDYGAAYLETGMAYLIRPETKTERYLFGIAWIDDAEMDASTDRDRGVQTWFGADPTLE